MDDKLTAQIETDSLINNTQSNAPRASMNLLRQYFMECLDDGQPHQMAEINIYVRKRLAESNLTLRGKYGDYINLAIRQLISSPDCPYKRVRQGVYQKDAQTSLPMHMGAAHELFSKCCELSEYAEQFFAESLPYQNMTSEDLQCYTVVKDRFPLLMDEILTYSSAIAAMVDDWELTEAQHTVPYGKLHKRENNRQR